MEQKSLEELLHEAHLKERSKVPIISWGSSDSNLIAESRQL